MNFSYTVTVEVHRAPPRSRFGDPVRVLHHLLPGCVMAPRQSADVADNSNRVIVGFTLYAPPGSDLLADDRVKTADGNFYDVVGEAASWRNPFTGTAFGVEAALQRVT